MKGSFNCMKAIGKVMMKEGFGKIMNIC